MSVVKKAVLSVVGKVLFRTGVVTRLDELTPQFLRVELEGPELRGVGWTPGDKVQLDVGGLELRTYTPLSWDAERGRTQLLIYLHGAETPACLWARRLQEGAPVRLFGPRRSIDVSGVRGPLAVFGDETSFGLACALASAAGRAPHLVAEVADVAHAGAVLDALGLKDAQLVKRLPHDAHLAHVEQSLRQLALRHPDVGVAFSGRAASIQELRRRLRGAPALGAPVKVKAYWADGKTGLD